MQILLALLTLKSRKENCGKQMKNIFKIALIEKNKNYWFN